jgi:hypothetical protein
MENKEVKLNEYQNSLLNNISKKSVTIHVTCGYGKVK